jgi:oxazoline/thiazoline dehydrogenase
MRGPLQALRASLLPTARLRRLRRGNGTAAMTISAPGAGSVTLRSPGPGVSHGLLALQRPGATLEALANIVHAREGLDGTARFLQAVQGLERAGLLCHRVEMGVQLVAELTPISPHFTAEFNAVAVGERLTLSRFALVRREGTGDAILESPLAHARVRLVHAVAWRWLHALSRRTTLAQLERSAARQERAALRAFVALLQGARFLATADEDHAWPLAPWEFADALLHARARRGRHRDAFGRVFPMRGRLAPLPRSKRVRDERTPLPRPNLRVVAARDASFTRVLESRRSLRAHARAAMDLGQLGEFLYRSARVQRRLAPSRPARPYEASLRPSPSGGACHPLELYVTINRCRDLARGVYHYDPEGHALTRIADASAVDALLQECPPPDNAPLEWHVLLVITARFGRVTWKYRGMSYATVLKDVGALMQTMYLVATAMRLAPCALGGGDAEHFARLLGSDYFEETSVGEFVIGRRTAARS